MSKEKVKGSPRPRYGFWLFLGLSIGVLGAGLVFWGLFEPHRPMVFAETSHVLENEQVYAAIYSLDEQEIYAQSGSGHLSIWDASSPNISPLYDSINQNWVPQWNLAHTQYLGLDYEQAAVRFDNTNQRITTYEHSGVYMVLWNPTTDRVITVGTNESKLWTIDGQLLKTFPQPINLSDITLWSPDGKHFAVWEDNGQNAGNTAFYDADGNVLGGFALKSYPSTYSWNSSSTALAITQYITDSDPMKFQLTVYSAEGQELWTEQLADEYSQVSWSPDGTVLTSISNYNPPSQANMYSIEGEHLAEFSVGNIFLWHPSGEILLTNTPDYSEMRLMDKHGTLIRTLPYYGDTAYTAPQWSPNGEILATWESNYDENVYTLYLWDKAGNLLHQMTAGTRIEALYWSPDNSRILTTGAYVARLWSVAEGGEINSLNHNWPIIFAQWSSDGSRVLTIGANTSSVGYENAVWTNEGEHLATLFSGDNTGIYVGDWRSDLSQALLISSHNLNVYNLQAGSIYFDFRFDN